MATLLLVRSTGDAGWFVRTDLRLDGVVVARLRPGERVRVTLSPGTHAVQAAMARSTSVPASITLENGETVRVVVEAGLLPEALDPARAVQLRVTRYPFELTDDATPLVRADGADARPPSWWRRVLCLAVSR
ncbi:hypothetical protein [Mumia sp. Pv 4-285]|uniref:hypothetical protein n=1 Tax=Mumia qirimensis TaxID=3234852 RepID=UPI00351CEF63